MSQTDPGPLRRLGLVSSPLYPNREDLAFEGLPGRSRMTTLVPKPLLCGGAGALAVTLALAGVVALSAPAAAAGDYDLGAIHISQPWSRATPKGAATGAGYMTLTNKGA